MSTIIHQYNFINTEYGFLEINNINYKLLFEISISKLSFLLECPIIYDTERPSNALFRVIYLPLRIWLIIFDI